MKPLPMPLRLAAGLVVSAVEEVQGLPRKIVELPVTAVSQVLQASMRMQQRVTELAIKGDQALGGLRPVPETPTWARFDEDDLEYPFDGGGLGGAVADTGVFEGGNGLASVPDPDDWDVPLPRAAARSVSPIHITREPEPAGDALDGAEGASAADGQPEVGPDGLEGYDDWSLPQLRGRFRSLSRTQVQELLAWETSHQDRAPYVTMLSNRLASISGR